ncbi:type II toxin-antitoxin system PemK/MazF family toxin [Microbacterium sp. M28]|nr:type II toxin-antitoxin system PemK/MazF family toxin [Microbacterium sp. M28]UYO98586.1 type II toxin-antitoxin system PemK/MazF family toxin [Microbacterium sp. M28]
MSSSRSLFAQITGMLVTALTGRTSRTSEREPGRTSVPESSPGRQRGSETIRIDPLRVDRLRVAYAPARDGAPDAGEIIWTWVPYEENDGRGKDRPVLVIGRQSDARVYAVRMTSRPHDGHRDYLSIGSGEWDRAGRESWVDIEELYSVHESGMRREAAILDRARYGRVAQALVQRYGWRTS